MPWRGKGEKCLAAGMDEYISKPVREQELRRLINQMAGRRKDGKDADQDHAADRTTDQAAPAAVSYRYRYIDLAYMKEISGGDTEYEKTVTQQFLEIVPADLRQMQEAWRQKDYSTLSRLAHTMKTSVSVMGLNEALGPVLDRLESDKGSDKESGKESGTESGEDPAGSEKDLAWLQDYCGHALEEAADFYGTLT